MSKTGGSIHSIEAYAQSKLIESPWEGILPRGITPSDHDVVFGNRGASLLVEFSSSKATWGELDIGQRRAYQDTCGRDMRNISVLAKHSVPIDRKISSVEDVDSFQVMYFHDGTFRYSPVYERERWKPFVKAWYEKPEQLRSYLSSL